jgi:hypothetical protein
MFNVPVHVADYIVHLPNLGIARLWMTAPDSPEVEARTSSERCQTIRKAVPTKRPTSAQKTISKFPSIFMVDLLACALLHLRARGYADATN